MLFKERIRSFAKSINIIGSRMDCWEIPRSVVQLWLLTLSQSFICWLLPCKCEVNSFIRTLPRSYLHNFINKRLWLTKSKVLEKLANKPSAPITNWSLCTFTLYETMLCRWKQIPWSRNVNSNLENHGTEIGERQNNK